MAFGSASSLATDRWMRRKGLPSWAQLLKVGNASLLHQHSSQKPTAQVSGSAEAIPISRSRLLFSFVQGIWGGDPPFRPEPSHSEKAGQSSPDGLPRDLTLCEPFLKSNPCCHL